MSLHTSNWISLLRPILSHLNGKERANIETVNKDFRNASNGLKTISFVKDWNEFERKNDSESDITNNNYALYYIQSGCFDDYKNARQYYNMDNTVIVTVSPVTTHTALNMVSYNSILYVQTLHFDTRLWVAKPFIIRKKLINIFKSLDDTCELGVCIRTSMTKNDLEPGRWHVGLCVGSNRLVFHPGCQWGNNRGLCRLEGPNGWNNEDMGYLPGNNEMHELIIFITFDGNVYSIIKTRNHEYRKQWKYSNDKTKKLFDQNEDNIWLNKNVIGYRIEAGNSQINGKYAVGIFGKLSINFGKRNINSREIDIL